MREMSESHAEEQRAMASEVIKLQLEILTR